MHESRQPTTTRLRAFKALYVLALLVMDVAMLRAAFILAYHLRQFGDPRAASQIGPLWSYDSLSVLYLVVMLVTFVLRRLYIPRRGVSRVDMLYQVASNVGIGWLLCLGATLLVYRALEPPRLMLVYWSVLSVAMVWFGRMVLDTILRRVRRLGYDSERVLIVGDGSQAHLISTKLNEAPELGFRIVGFVSAGTDRNGAVQVSPLLGDLSQVSDVVRRHDVGEVIIAAPGISHPQLVEIVTGCTHEGVNITIFPDIFELMAREVQTSALNGLPLMRVRDVALRGWSRGLKRAMDVAVSWTALVVLSPLMLFTALLVKLTSPSGRILYVQERVGLDGQPFQMIKFRSMRPDAEADTGPVFARPDDARRTPIGAFMRRFSIDEWPQFVNVLVGEMSLVGPRPERPEFVAQFARMVPRYKERHNEKAGLTGWAQVNGHRGQGSIEERTTYDLFYVENWSLAFDLKILLKTIGTVIHDRNAY